MKKVQRYDPADNGATRPMLPREDGDYVAYEDYVALMAHATPQPSEGEKTAHIQALRDLRVGVEMDRHNLDDGDAKLAALDTAIAAMLAAPTPEPVAVEQQAVAAEIIENMIRNIEADGMYSKESTLGFLTQAFYCLRPANPAAPALDQQAVRDALNQAVMGLLDVERELRPVNPRMAKNVHVIRDAAIRALKSTKGGAA